MIFSVIRAYAAISSTSCARTKVGDPKGDPPALPPECADRIVAGPCQDPPRVRGDETIQEEIKQKWDINLEGFTSPEQGDQLVAIREIFYQVDCRGFLQDIKGTTITSNGEAGGVSRQLSCPSEGGTNVEFGVYDYSFTKGLIIHELTHVWQKCSTRGEANVLEIPPVYKAEGGLTKYSRNECPNLSVGDNWRNEDHAETIALFLNPDRGELTCGDNAGNPYLGGDFPRHRGVAEQGVPKL